MSIDYLAEFDRQAAALGVDHPLLGQLREKVEALSQESLEGNLAMCLVLNKRPFPAKKLMERVRAKNAQGFVDMHPQEPGDFLPIESLKLPDAELYLLWDIDTGHARLNVSPEDSLAAIVAEKRTPLTLEEGVMVALLHPQIFSDKKKLNCIQMPGSRIAQDQRVPSIWFSKGAPRLGWCWNRNIHTWLASASAKQRIEAN